MAYAATTFYAKSGIEITYAATTFYAKSGTEIAPAISLSKLRYLPTISSSFPTTTPLSATKLRYLPTNLFFSYRNSATTYRNEFFWSLFTTAPLAACRNSVVWLPKLHERPTKFRYLLALCSCYGMSGTDGHVRY
eukprot:3940264-Rhodomonas_salina.3